MKCPVQQPDECSWEYFTNQNKQFCVKFEIGCSFGTPQVVWLAGPFKGALTDAAVAKSSGILDCLRQGERLLADKAYMHLEQCITPVSGHRYTLSSEQNVFNYLVYSARSTVERLIRRIRIGKFSLSVWRYDLRLLALCMQVQCQITNECLKVEPLG